MHNLIIFDFTTDMYTQPDSDIELEVVSHKTIPLQHMICIIIGF